jgi:hypothetical protein
MPSMMKHGSTLQGAVLPVPWLLLQHLHPLCCGCPCLPPEEACQGNPGQRRGHADDRCVLYSHAWYHQGVGNPCRYGCFELPDYGCCCLVIPSACDMRVLRPACSHVCTCTPCVHCLHISHKETVRPVKAAILIEDKTRMRASCNWGHCSSITGQGFGWLSRRLPLGIHLQ